MEVILGILSLVAIIGLIVGLINPSLILRKTKKPTRLKVVGYWFLAMLIVTLIGNVSQSDEDKAKSKIETAKKHIKNKNYTSALSKLEGINEDNPLYLEAQRVFQQADSLNNLTDEDIRIAKEIKDNQELKALLENGISKIDSIDFTEYRKTKENIQFQLLLFSNWGNAILKGEESENAEIQKLAKQLKPKVLNIQVREFPILRKTYSKTMAKEVWEHDIDVTSNGLKNKYINFTGGTFAANKNKKDWQEEFHNDLMKLRYTRANYRWYKGQEEYTYYKIYEGKDSDLVTTN